MKALRKSKHHSTHLQNSWNKYGECSFSFEVLENVDVELLFWLDHFKSYDPKFGFNICEKAHSTVGRKPSGRCVQASSKEWVVTTPDGEEIKIKNLTGFCRDNNLDRSSMKNIARGLGFRYKGWKCRPGNLSLEEWNQFREKKLGEGILQEMDCD